MNTFTIISTALLCASTTLAGCYSGGQAWPVDGAFAVQDAAESYAGGTWPAGVEEVYQVPIDGICVKFILENISGALRGITYDEAFSGFNKEYQGCSYGGDTSYTNWRYV